MFGKGIPLFKLFGFEVKAGLSRFILAGLAAKCDASNTVASSNDAAAALTKMHQNSHSRLMVVDNGRLVGTISLKDLLRFFSLKLDLEE